LKSGFSAKTILDFFTKKNPHLASKINSALSLGYSADYVLKHLTGGRGDYENADSTLTESEQTHNVDAQRKKTIGTNTALAVAAPLGAYALQRAIPQAVQQVAPQLAQQAVSPVQTPITPIAEQTPGIAPNPAPIAQQTPAIAPVNPNIQVAQNILNKSPVKQFIDKALTMNQSSDDVAAAARKIHPKEVGAIEKVAKVPLEEIIRDLKPETPNAQEKQLQSQERQNVESIGQELNQVNKSPERPKELETEGNLALMPNGDLGEIQSVKNGIAKMNVNGIERHRKYEDLETLPITQPDIADLYSNLVQAIPEELRSSVINFAGYDADFNELAFRPHNGALYIYKDIPLDFADKLKNSMFKAKTTGENFYGAWGEGEGSRFSGLGQLIRDLQKQYGGKGKEYTRKYQTIYDFLGAPEAAKKAKHKKEIEEKKASKQKDKDEKKKRKKTI